MSTLRKLTYFIKKVILEEIFISRNSVMLAYQLIEKNATIAKNPESFGIDFVSFRSGLNHKKVTFSIYYRIKMMTNLIAKLA